MLQKVHLLPNKCCPKTRPMGRVRQALQERGYFRKVHLLPNKCGPKIRPMGRVRQARQERGYLRKVHLLQNKCGPKIRPMGRVWQARQERRVPPQGPSTVEQVRPKNTTDGPGATRLAGKRAPQKAAVTAVNITQKAQAFIDVMNRTWHDISSWGMTSQYSFWTGKHNLHRERPISAHAGVFECDNEMSDDFDDDVKMAVFAWYIPQKICSPVPIYVNVTVAEVSNGELVEKNMALNFNDRNIIKRKTPPKKRRRRTKGLKKIVEMCKFTVNVTFHGWFAYETDNEVTGSRYYSVGIGVLQDKANGLIRRKHNVLSYTIKGLFQRTVFLKKS
ncbi:uncharacterized protein LOC119450613 isoform X18 [Dermacentor silvarum]|uniref:uncharacterized protein LOC119450613 isoform X18 n=1 Tax=Dermacentor silvarum TaxID=543639 RepID=UPI0021012A48|nr:uncharacterized protein LOC119450613 isoform X18 [Dermacentor silvarum]